MKQGIRRFPNLTIADICSAIAAGQLKATVDAEMQYRIDRGELLRYASQTLFGSEADPGAYAQG